MDSILSLLGLTYRAGRVSVGEEPVGAACRARKAVLLLLAADIAENSARRARHFAEIGACPVVPLPFDKAALGSALGRASCAMAAVTDIGLAAALLKKLELLDPAAYGALSAQSEEKAQKALLRRKETRERKRPRAKRKPRS